MSSYRWVRLPHTYGYNRLTGNMMNRSEQYIPIIRCTVCFLKKKDNFYPKYSDILTSKYFYPPTKLMVIVLGSSVRVSVRAFCPSVHTFCLSGTMSQYLLVRFDSFLEQMISTMDSRYPMSFVKMAPLTLELLPLY